MAPNGARSDYVVCEGVRSPSICLARSHFSAAGNTTNLERIKEAITATTHASPKPSVKRAAAACYLTSQSVFSR